MKKLFTLVLVLILAISMLPGASAAEQGTVVSRQKVELENGLVIVDTLLEYDNARVMGKVAKRTKDVYLNEVMIARITMVASFNYDGTTVSVTSASVTEKETYQGWGYAQDSLTTIGGTATLNARLTKLFYPSIPFAMTITCDANGNLS